MPSNHVHQVAPAIADEYLPRLDRDAAAHELAELTRLTADPLRGLGSGIPTPRPAAARAVRQAA